MKSGEERKILPSVKCYVSGGGEVWLGANIAVRDGKVSINISVKIKK